MRPWRTHELVTAETDVKYIDWTSLERSAYPGGKPKQSCSCGSKAGGKGAILFFTFHAKCGCFSKHLQTRLSAWNWEARPSSLFYSWRPLLHRLKGQQKGEREDKRGAARQLVVFEGSTMEFLTCQKFSLQRRQHPHHPVPFQRTAAENFGHKNCAPAS